MTYRTRQQQAVLSCIEAHRDETLSAQRLADELRAQGEAVGIATVYRQLEKLEKQGCVHKVLTEEGAFYRYCSGGGEADGCFLLKCERCGRIEHVDCRQLSPLYEHLEQEHHFHINPRRTMLYGCCARCAEAER